MLKTLALRGFRGFESYELTDLATVNLIVGKNNCGKTTVLEAIELLVSNGHPFMLHDVAGRRGEMTSAGNSVEVSHLFLGMSANLVLVSNCRPTTALARCLPALCRSMT
jgi:predicted ATPase